MTDVFPPDKRSSVMRAITAKDTKPEMILRSALHRLGFRFRLHDPTLAGKPDIVLPKFGALIQVRGCFWHGHTCIDGHIPKSRTDYWLSKICNNKLRDHRTDSKNRRLGWSVLVVWECRLVGKPADREIQRVAAFLRTARPSTDILPSRRQ
jgi:DNA mismatch endonuclease (patch repair protein)